ncbi:hypothetical protein FF100_25380 [Methylobacterium terricola]|uniref:Uncharacterized protein n=1 Tax=Methylobacterium terricola TaxID=2583531 RepID=A0A5C4LA94_9HYPH|nr:hypothetical protein [Methylobacterium terricola]TNC09554.1 hypothetical protein FF100_25380 [Methylobacterium terricola]
MIKPLLIAGLAGAAMLMSLAAQAQTRVVPPKTNLPSTGSAFAIKNGGAFANQGGIATHAGRPGANLIGNDGGSLMGRSGGGILSHNGGLIKPR